MCPLGVKIIAVLSMAYSALSAIPKALVLLNPEIYEGTKSLVEASSSQGIFAVPFSVQLFHSLMGVFVVFISCVYMLKGKSWALYLFTAWIAASLTLTLIIVGPSNYALIKLPLAIAVLAILYTGKSRTYLVGDSDAMNA